MTESMMKRCPKCASLRNRANFASNGYCKACDKLYHAEKRAKEPRKCRQCKEYKQSTAFANLASRYCTECSEENAERRKVSQAERVYEKPDVINSLCQAWLQRKWLV